MPKPDERHDPPSLADLDRRRSDRVAAAGTVTLRLAHELPAGRLRDRSPSGVFVELEGPLELVLEFEGEAGPCVRRASLVRAQALPGQRSGWALEFSADPAAGG